MISMLCQKTNNGTITSTKNKELFNFLLLGEQQQQQYKKPIELIRKEATFDNGMPESSSLLDLETILLENKTESNDIKINKNVDFSDTKTVHSYRNTVRIKSKQSDLPSYRSIKSSVIRNHHSKNKQTPSTPPIKVFSNDAAVSSTSTLSMEQFNVQNFHREPKKLNKKKLKHVKTLLDNQINKSVSHKQIFDKLNEFLTEEHEFTQKINENIEKSDTAELRKRELIYKNWHLNVYEPIQKEIQKNMNSTTAEYARNVRNLKYLEYLQYCNKYGCAYQEDYETTEYDPTDVISMCACLPVKLKDPTTIRQRTQYKEDKAILKLVTGHDFSNKQTDRIKLPLIINDNESRTDLDWNSWLLDQYNSIESNVRTKSGKKCQSTRFNSEYNLNWNRDNSLETFISSNHVNSDFHLKQSS